MSRIAYGMYNYDFYPAKGTIAVADFDGSTITRQGNLVEGLTNDAKVFGYKNLKGEPRILLSETEYVDGVAKDALFTAYDKDLKRVGNLNRSVIGNLKNVYRVAEDPSMYITMGHLMVIDYDEHIVVGLKMDADDYINPTPTLVYDSFQPAAGTKGYGVDVVVKGQKVYALFVSAKDAYGGDYTSYTITRLDVSLKKEVSTDVPTFNPFSLQIYGDNLYVTSVGGLQHYGSTNGEKSKIERLSTSFADGDQPDVVLKGGTDAKEGDFRALAFNEKDGDAFILTGRFNAKPDNDTFDGALYHLDKDTLPNLITSDNAKISDEGIADEPVTFDHVKGYTWGLLYSEEKKAVWAAAGNGLAVYKYEENSGLTELASADANTLTGTTGYSLNGFTIVSEGQNFSGATLPAFASVSAEALAERKKLLKK